MRLSIKALQPTSIDEYIAEHQVGETVTGRVVDVSGNRIKVELGEGVTGFASAAEERKQTAAGAQKADLSAMTAMLTAKWKSGGAGEPGGGGVQAGQIRGFRIAKIDVEKKRIDLEMA
jgi:small subunit ribosomal protein S1